MEGIENYYDRVERQSTEAIVKTFERIRKQKEMENKRVIFKGNYEKRYYKPSIEEIHVGYECEYDSSQTGEPAKWEKITIVLGDFYTGVVAEFGRETLDRVRTPYLSKENIEAEGWEIKDTHWSGSNFSFEKGNIVGIQLKDKRLVFIMKDVLLDEYTERTSNGQLFLGKCPSINEFRFITRSLA